MFCTNCGAKLEDDAQFCPNCGSPVEKEDGAPAPNNTPAQTTPQPAPDQNKAQKARKEKNTTRTLACAAMVAVVVAVVFTIKGFTGQGNGNIPDQGQQGALAESLNEKPSDNNEKPSDNNEKPSDNQKPEVSSAPVRTQADLAAVQAFVKSYGGVWKVEKYFDVENSKWKTYELGKRLLIAAYNFLNDGSYTTGGYNQIIGYDTTTTTTSTPEGGTCTKCKTGKMRRVTGLGALLAASNTLQCDFCGYEEVIRTSTSSTPKYEYVPEEKHEYHGKDIEYSAPYITLTYEAVDMSGMGGSVFALTEFHVETINGRTYLINDKLGFALTYDGDYLEYCEPDARGHYQGYYAFIY